MTRRGCRLCGMARCVCAERTARFVARLTDERACASCDRWEARIKELEERLARIRGVAEGRE